MFVFVFFFFFCILDFSVSVNAGSGGEQVVCLSFLYVVPVLQGERHTKVEGSGTTEVRF